LKAAFATTLLFLATAVTSASPAVATVGRDLVLSRSVPGRVVAVASDVRIEAPVAGDVVVWGGTVSFGPNGSVAGNLVVFGGDILPMAGRPLPVAGAISTPGTLLQLYLAEMRRAPWDASGANVRSPVFWGLRVLALAAWLAIAVALLYFFGSPLSRAADRAESDWAGALTAGALGVLTLFLAAAATLTLLPSSLGVPITLATESVRPNAFIFCYEWTLIEVERVVSNALDSGPGVIGLGTSRSTLIHPCSCVARLPPQFPPQASRTDNEFPLPRLLDFRQFARLPHR